MLEFPLNGIIEYVFCGICLLSLGIMLFLNSSRFVLLSVVNFFYIKYCFIGSISQIQKLTEKKKRFEIYIN